MYFPPPPPPPPLNIVFIFRNDVNAKGAKDLYPPYSKVLEAKTKCSVPIEKTEVGCSVDAQMLFNATITKIWLHHVPEKKRLVQQGQTLQALYKVGLDGTNGVQVINL